MAKQPNTVANTAKKPEPKQEEKKLSVPKTGGGLAATYELPEFLQAEDADAGGEQFAQFIVPPRLKVVQKQADDELLQVFNPGDVILVQQGVDPILVASIKLNENKKPGDEGNPFWFTPIFFFCEWCTWNPIELKGSAPAIAERTVDPNDPLVAKCRNPKLRQEKVGEGQDGKPQYRRHVEHLNFVVRIQNHPTLSGVEAILGFARGEHKAGSSFMALHRARKAPLYGCNYEAVVGKRSGTLGQWHGINMQNPSDDSGVAPFVSAEEFAELKQLHSKLADAHAKNLIMVDYEREDDSDAPGNSKEF